MGEDVSGFQLLKKASVEELFYVQNGLSITSIRDLIVQLRNMKSEVFIYHVNTQKNDFSLWVKNVFGDEVLSARIEKITDKNEMATIIEERLLELEDEELKKFGVHIPSNDLLSLEEYIEKQMKEGISEKDIQNVLSKKGWEKNIISLVLTGRNNPYKEFRSIEYIENIENFHEVLEQLKEHIIGAIGQGSTVEDIKEFLRKAGWHAEIVDYILYDIFKPHPNLKKLALFIIHKIKDNNESVEQVKQQLLHLGWKDYIIDSVIYGIKQPENSLGKILSYLKEFSEDNHDQIKAFLLQMGWKELDVNDAIRQKEIEEVQEKLLHSFNLEKGNQLKEQSLAINEHVVRLFSNNLWDSLIEGYQKKGIDEFQQSNGELHMSDEYMCYFALDDLESIHKLEGKKVGAVWFKDEKSPLLIQANHPYLIMPRIIKRQCVVCGNIFPVTKMRRIEMWDHRRTHKVTKYVCFVHAKEMENFLEETKIVQS